MKELGSNDAKKKTVLLSEDARIRLLRLGINPNLIAEKSSKFRIVAADSISKAWVLTREGNKIPLKKRFSIGRDAVNQYPIEETFVSRRHAVIVKEKNDEFWLMDLGSTNGTLLNGKLVEKPVRLLNGDEILIGNHSLIFHLGEIDDSIA